MGLRAGSSAGGQDKGSARERAGLDRNCRRISRVVSVGRRNAAAHIRRNSMAGTV